MAAPDAKPIHTRDITEALAAGWADFKRAPLWGLGFASVYALGGLALLAMGAGMLTWTLVMSLGFPLIAPFAAVGLYEVSRRLERGEALDRGVLGIVAAERNRQMPWVGMMLLLVFLFWSFFAHMLFAIFFGAEVLLGGHDGLALLATPRGMLMGLAQLAAGGAVAALLFALTAFALPMLLDRELDFVTAMMASLRTVRDNPRPMALWAAIVAGMTFAAMIPAFLGLLVALPVLGHATWHLYRRAFGGPAAAAAPAPPSQGTPPVSPPSAPPPRADARPSP